MILVYTAILSFALCILCFTRDNNEVIYSKRRSSVILVIHACSFHISFNVVCYHVQDLGLENGQQVFFIFICQPFTALATLV